MTPISKVKRLWQALTSKDPNSLRQRFLRKAAGTFGLRVASTALAFLTSILLARLLGVVGFGIYAYALSWGRFLTIPATLGLDNLLVREIAICQTRSSWGVARGLLSWANYAVLILSSGLGLIAVVLALGFRGDDPQTLLTFSLAMLMLPIMTVRNLRLAAMRGLHHIVESLVPELVIAPVLIIVLTGGAYLLLQDDLTPAWAMGLKVIVTVITLGIGMRSLNKVLPTAIKHTPPEYRIKSWIRSALPLAFLGSTFVINSQADLIMLGAIRGTEAVGLYLPVTRGAQLINFVTIAANTVLAPAIASFYSAGNTKKLQQMILKSTWSVFGVALLIATGLIVFGRWFLLLFGAEFTQGHTALSILCCGQLVNAATCAVGWLLMMTKYERQMAMSDGLGAIVNIILNALLIPRWGIEGAAAATATSLATVNIINAILVQKQLSINATIFGLLLRRKA